MEEKTTIIIVTYNAYDYVKKCIESVLRYTSSLHEIIIIDNKSDKKTRDYIKSFSSDKRFNIILNKENILWCPACNQGFKQASSDSQFIVLLNSDIEIHQKDWILRMQQPMLNNDGIGLTGTKHNFQPIKPTYGALDGCCLMIKKTLLDNIGYFDENYPWNGAPFIFTQKAWKRGIKYYYVNDSKLMTHFGRKSRLDNKVQLRNNSIDKRAIILNEGLKPSLDIFSWVYNKIFGFDINKQIF